VDEARRVKPTIPLIGHDQIPIRDELDLVRNLSADPSRPSAG
jgi:hypothetical protein